MTLGNIFWLLIVGMFAYMMIKKGGCCGGHTHGEGDHGGEKLAGSDSSEINHQSNSDPVCGMTVQDKSLTSEYSGRSFHFCSEHCQKVFALNPHKYA